MKFRYVTFLWPAMLTACGPQHIRVADTWISNVSDFDMVPIYPPQEDVLPGDVFLLGTDSTANRPPKWITRVGSLGRSPVKQALTKAYQDRLTIAPVKPSTPAAAPNATTAPAPTTTTTTSTTAPNARITSSVTTSTPSAKAVPAAAGGAAAAKTKGPVYDVASADDDSVNGSTTDPMFRMHVLALPELKLASYSSATADGGGPLSAALSLIGGGSFTSQSSVDLTLENLEELHLPASDTVRLVQKHQAAFLALHLTPIDLITLVATRGAADVKALCETDFRKLDDDGIALLVANGVVFAHSISYSYNDGLSVAGALGAKLSAPGAVATPAATGAASTPPATAAPATLADQVNAQVAALQGLATNYGATMPGVQVSFGIGKTGNLTFTKTSSRPLAVGFVGRMQYTMGELMKTIQLDIAGSGPGGVAPDPADRETLKNAANWVADTCGFYNVNGHALQAFLLGSSDATPPKSLSLGAIPRLRAMSWSH
jgi:hypothetical protein